MNKDIYGAKSNLLVLQIYSATILNILTFTSPLPVPCTIHLHKFVCLFVLKFGWLSPDHHLAISWLSSISWISADCTCQLVIDWLWAGYQLSIGWPLAGYEQAISYLWTGYGLAIGWLSAGYGLPWLWAGYRLVFKY